jgi:hypothetical protein
LDPSTIYLSYPGTIFRSYGAGGINWSDFFFDGVEKALGHVGIDEKIKASRAY